MKDLKEKPEGYEEKPPRRDNKGGGRNKGKDRHHSRKPQRTR